MIDSILETPENEDIVMAKLLERTGFTNVVKGLGKAMQAEVAAHVIDSAMHLVEIFNNKGDPVARSY